jgi:acyl-CoA synthetase (NDP forming)
MTHRSAQELVTPQRLRAFFAPESIALVGASDNSGWARFIVAGCAAAGFTGPLTAVHPRAGTAFGLPVVPSLRDLPTPADLAFILAPAHAVEGVLDDMGATGIPNAVVLASGYRETGQDGRALEDAMTARAIANGVTVLGPNCLGFVNAHTRSAPYALSLTPPLTAGPHKSDIGGVALGLGSAAEVRAGYEKARAAGEAVPGASIDGVLVTPMRSGGTELLAGVTVDTTFGPVLAVGLGGIWTEILQDTSLRLLPVEAAEVKRMLAELRGWPLLRGARGTQPANLDAVAEAIAGIGDAALSLNGTLRALEVNPLWVNGDQVEALDVLVVTGPTGMETEQGT